jgi:hypothetical protein
VHSPAEQRLIDLENMAADLALEPGARSSPMPSLAPFVSPPPAWAQWTAAERLTGITLGYGYQPWRALLLQGRRPRPLPTHRHLDRLHSAVRRT